MTVSPAGPDRHPLSVPAGLTELEDAILAVASRAYDRAGELSNRIRELGLTETAFYVRLNRLLDDEAALAAYPVEVNRMRRQRADGVRVRGR